MRVLKVFLASLLLVVPGLVVADIEGMPAGTTWYLHIDFATMRAEGPGQGVYQFLVDEVFDDLRDETGVDMEKELDALTGYSLQGQGPVFVFSGDISQMSRDRLMAVIAAAGDLDARKSRGKAYYRLLQDERNDNKPDFETDSIEMQLEGLERESWISMALQDKILLTSSEEQMQALLARDGKIAGSRAQASALIVLTAEKPLLQAGMDSAALGEESNGNSAWESNLLSNTEQVAFLIAAVRDKLAIEARLTTTEPEMAESLASVARGLVSLAAFDDDMDPEAVALLAGLNIETDGPNLVISLAVDPSLVVASLRDE